MATKKVVRRSSSKISKKETMVRPAPMSQAVVEETIIEQISTPTKSVPKILYLIPVIIAVLALVLWRNKGLIVAATVNNTPVWRWNLEQRFVSRYGTQTLDEMINEQILKNEAAKQGISVSDSEVSSKISEIEKTLQGKISLKDALAQQGMTMDDFKNQVEVQVLIEKLTAKKVGVSDQEVTDYIAQNKETMTATDEGAMKEEAKTAILQNKRNQEFQKIFADLKKNAKVTKYL